MCRGTRFNKRFKSCKVAGCHDCNILYQVFWTWKTRTDPHVFFFLVSAYSTLSRIFLSWLLFETPRVWTYWALEKHGHTLPTRIQYMHAQWQLYISSLGVVYCERYVSGWTRRLGCVGACFTSALWLCQKRPCGPSVEWELKWPMTNGSCRFFISTNLFDRNIKRLIMHKSCDFWLQGTVLPF